MKLLKTPAWREAVGERLVRSREALGKNQANMAKALGITPQRLNNYETGFRPLDIEVAMEMCERYGLTLDWLYRGNMAGLPIELADKMVPFHVPPGFRQ